MIPLVFVGCVTVTVTVFDKFVLQEVFGILIAFTMKVCVVVIRTDGNVIVPPVPMIDEPITVVPALFHKV